MKAVRCAVVSLLVFGFGLSAHSETDGLKRSLTELGKKPAFSQEDVMRFLNANEAIAEHWNAEHRKAAAEFEAVAQASRRSEKTAGAASIFLLNPTRYTIQTVSEKTDVSKLEAVANSNGYRSLSDWAEDSDDIYQASIRLILLEKYGMVATESEIDAFVAKAKERKRDDPDYLAALEAETRRTKLFLSIANASNDAEVEVLRPIWPEVNARMFDAKGPNFGF